MPVRSIRDGTLMITNALGTITVTVTFVEGGLTWTQRQPATIQRDRGVLDHARRATEEALEGSFSFRYQDTTFRSALVDVVTAGEFLLPAYPGIVRAGWTNPVTTAVVKAGATFFGRTLRAGDVVGLGFLTNVLAALDLGGGPNLVFQIDDPATGSVDETILFMAARIGEYQLIEGEEFDQATVSFRSGVKQPHIY